MVSSLVRFVFINNFHCFSVCLSDVTGRVRQSCYSAAIFLSTILVWIRLLQSVCFDLALALLKLKQTITHTEVLSSEVFDQVFLLEGLWILCCRLICFPSVKCL